MQLGWRYPDATPAQDTRYQDIRLYGRALIGGRSRSGCRYEDYVAEVTEQAAAASGIEDQWHAVSEFYFNNVDKNFRAIQSQIDQLDAQLDKALRGRRR